MSKLNQKQFIDLFKDWLDIWYIGVYDSNIKKDSRKFWVQYIIELALELFDYQKTIDLFYGGTGEIYKLPWKFSTTNNDIAYSMYEMID